MRSSRAFRWMVAFFLASSFIALPIGTVMAQDDYAFGTETVNKGSSVNPANKNAEDAAYNTLTESDQYTDTNFSASSESMTYGTEGGDAFPGSLNTDDASRRTYTEEGEAPANDNIELVPTSDVSVGFDVTYPTSPSDHYSKVDDGASHDNSATYNRAVTNNDKDIYGLEDMSEPSGTYDLDVTIYVVCQDTGTGNAFFDAGVVISSTEYIGINDQQAPNSWTSYNYFWEENPAGGEWTYTAINGMNLFVNVYDAAPDVDVTSVYVVVTVDYDANYKLDGVVTFSSVTSSGQTMGYQVLLQGYRSGSENFGVYAWDYVAEAWNLKDTIEDGSDTDYNFALTSDERDGTGNEVKVRVLGLTETGDSTQDVVYLDVLKIRRIEQGYALDVELTATTVPEYGNITLRIKGYVDAEYLQVDVWNYTSSAYDTDKLQISDTENAWQTTIDLCDDHHRSGQSVKIRLVDVTAASSDTTKSSFYLDAVWVTHYYTDPVISDYGASPDEVTEDDPIIFFMTYTDYDDQAPSYVYVHIDDTDYLMTANDSEDLTYHDSKLYYLSKSDLSVGEHPYYFKVKDAESGDITTTPSSVTVNAAENLPPSFTSTPETTGYNNTLYSYDADADDEDELTFDLEGNITDWASIVPATGVVSGTPTSVGSFWMNVSVSDGINPPVWQNTTVTISEAPEPPVGGDLELNIRISFGFLAMIGVIAFLMAWVVMWALK